MTASQEKVWRAPPGDWDVRSIEKITDSSDAHQPNNRNLVAEYLSSSNSNVGVNFLGRKNGKPPVEKTKNNVSQNSSVLKPSEWTDGSVSLKKS